MTATRCPAIADLPPAPAGRTGWPWTDAAPALPSHMPDGSPWPRVAIVTPSYNQARFLEETIRSVLLQGYPDLEYRIVDGGSTDGSVEVIRKYEPWLASWVSEPDRGQSHAINKGFERATGEVIAWLNSDDAYLPGAIRLGVEGLKRTGADLVYGNAVVIDDRDRVLADIETPPLAPDWFVTEPCRIVQAATFFGRSVFETVGPLREDLHYALDYEYWIRLSQVGRLEHVDEPLARIRMYPGCKTGGRIFDMRRETWAVFRETGGRLASPQGWFELKSRAWKWIRRICWPLVILRRAWRDRRADTGPAQ
jgi:glycosyltransferase involved in cell wall biosynthesis